MVFVPTLFLYFITICGFYLILVDLDDLMQEDYVTEQKCTWATTCCVQAQLKQMLLDEGTGATLLENHATELVIQVLFSLSSAMFVPFIPDFSHPSFFFIYKYIGYSQDLHLPKTI